MVVMIMVTTMLTLIMIKTRLTVLVTFLIAETFKNMFIKKLRGFLHVCAWSSSCAHKQSYSILQTCISSVSAYFKVLV